MRNKQTIISFDLDGVLFVDPNRFETETELPALLTRLYPDHLRKGTVELLHTLKKQGFSIWVYTSSYRKERYIQGLFWHYGIKFDRIINGYRHDELVQKGRKNILPSKMPGFFQISLHIDDEDSVVKNGKDYGFHVLQITGPDPLWVEKIISEANRVREAENNRQKQISKNTD